MAVERPKIGGYGTRDRAFRGMVRRSVEKMKKIRLGGKSTGIADEQKKVRAESRRFVGSLSVRFGELEKLARKAKDFQVCGPAQLNEFRHLFMLFRALSDEFLSLSELTKRSLDKFRRDETAGPDEYDALDDHFRRLQVPILQHMISTNLRLLRIWDDCLRCGESLPYGAYDLFLDTLRIIYQARTELAQPRYAGLLDEVILRNADRVDRLLDTLMKRAPQLLELVTGNEPSAANNHGPRSR